MAISIARAKEIFKIFAKEAKLTIDGDPEWYEDRLPEDGDWELLHHLAGDDEDGFSTWSPEYCGPIAELYGEWGGFSPVEWRLIYFLKKAIAARIDDFILTPVLTMPGGELREIGPRMRAAAVTEIARFLAIVAGRLPAHFAAREIADHEGFPEYD